MPEIKKPQSTLYPQGSMHASLQFEKAKAVAKKKKKKKARAKGKPAGRMK